MKLKEIAKFLENGSPEIKSLINLIRTERPYRTPKGFIRWETLSAILACCIVSRDSPTLDAASRFNSYKCALWFVQDAPLYALSPGLLQAFLDSDVLDQRELFREFDPPLKTFMVLFPQGMVKTPDGSHLDWGVVHFADIKNPLGSTGDRFGITVPYFEHDHDVNLHWSGVCDDQTVWFSGSGLSRDGELIHSDDEHGRDKVTEADREFLAQMRSLTLQCLLALSFSPDLVEVEAIQPQPRINQGTRSKPSHPVTRQVRWLGKNYSYKRRAGCFSNGRKPPRGHWRKAHSRRVAVGKNREGREWRWFPANWVGDG